MNMTVLYKKCTYGLLLIATTLIGCAFNFTSANNYTFVGDNEEYEYTPGTITFSNSFTLSENSVVSFEGTDCYLNISIYEDTNHGSYCSIYVGYDTVSVEELSDGDCNLQSGVTYNVFSQDLLFSSITITDGVSSGGGSNSGSDDTCDCPVCESTFSTLFVNGTQITGSSNIYITIPEEIERDYVNINDETDIEITGYGYDQNAMQSMVNTQFTPPSAEDMKNIIGKVADFLPLIAIMLLIVYAWWLIKKVF